MQIQLAMIEAQLDGAADTERKLVSARNGGVVEPSGIRALDAPQDMMPQKDISILIQPQEDQPPCTLGFIPEVEKQTLQAPIVFYPELDPPIIFPSVKEES